MQPRKSLIAAWLVVVIIGLAGCDNSGPGDKTKRNIDESMEEVEESLDEVGKEIEEDAEEE